MCQPVLLVPELEPSGSRNSSSRVLGSKGLAMFRLLVYFEPKVRIYSQSMPPQFHGTLHPELLNSELMKQQQCWQSGTRLDGYLGALQTQGLGV